MLLIGSHALIENGYDIGRSPSDFDYICTFEDFNKKFKEMKKDVKHCVPLSATKYHVVDRFNMNYEFEIAWPDSAAHELLVHLGAIDNHVTTPVEVLLALKHSHKYLKDSPHFLKTMRDIQFLEKQGVVLNQWLLDWLPWRERETYVYKHPKLDVSKGEFFSGDNVNYVYSHDALHEVLALDGKPAYKSYMKEGSEVMTSREKFFSCSDRIRLLGGVEESLVLCAERSLIPYNFGPDADRMFEFALQKLCTSISSGWFRKHCWESYDEILDIYKNECQGLWVGKLKMAINKGIKRYGED